jgi:hypothetical protein
MTKQIITDDPNAGPIEREITRHKWERLVKGDLIGDSQLLARHLDAMNTRLDALEGDDDEDPQDCESYEDYHDDCCHCPGSCYED